MVVRSGGPTAHCSPAVWRCTEGGPLPTAPQRCGGVLKEAHCPLLPSGVAVYICMPMYPLVYTPLTTPHSAMEMA